MPNDTPATCLDDENDELDQQQPISNDTEKQEPGKNYTDHSDKLTPCEIAEYKEAFAMFDESGTGELADAQEDLPYLLNSIGINPPLTKLAKMVEKYGTPSTASDDDGSRETIALEFKAFLSLMVDLMNDPPEGEQDLVEAYALYDEEETGKMTMKQFKEITYKIVRRNPDEEAYDDDLDKLFKESGIEQCDDDTEVDYRDLVEKLFGSG